ncbi:MAG: hypothetical protein AAFX55_19425 [Bacteroidota bacterium]
MNFKKSKNVNGSIRIIDVKTTVCVVLITALCLTFSLSAQTTPEPPTPPKTSNSKTISRTSQSVSVENDDNEIHNSSVSVSVSDDEYKFRARYHQSKNEGVKTILIEALGKDNLSVKGNTYLWSESKNGNDIFECKLTKGHLRMYLDTDLASKGYTEKINALGKDLKHFISGTDAKKESERAVAKAKRELERAERELERAKREAEQAARAAKRAAKN